MLLSIYCADDFNFTQTYLAVIISNYLFEVAADLMLNNSIMCESKL